MITSPNVNNVKISFDYFETEYYNDILYFGEGLVPDKQNALGSFDGLGIPDAFAINAESGWFYFVSNEAEAFPGFSFSWEGYGGKSVFLVFLCQAVA